MNRSSNSIGLNPQYPFEPIRGLSVLSKALGIRENILIKYADRANHLYRVAKQETKKDGSIRQTFDAYPRLKAIQIRIQQRILKRVVYPAYLHGSLPGCSPRTNASIHTNAKIAFSEDIANFFPSVRHALVKDIWASFMGFSDDVAEILTALTMKDGELPQGAVTSSYLANLIFWAYEPSLVKRLNARGLKYSRYVDDISVSSKTRLRLDQQTRLVSDIYGMLLHHELQPKREKHEVSTAGRPMSTTKLLSNRRVALPVEFRQNARAAVFALEKRIASGDYSGDITKELARVASRVGRLGSYHPKEGIALKKRLTLLRNELNLVLSPPPTLDSSRRVPATTNSNTLPPWN